MKIPASPGLRPSPASSADCVIRTLTENPKQPIQYYIYQDVVEELAFAAGYEDRPYAAALVGGFGLEGTKGFVEVTGFVGGHWADEVSDLYKPLRQECEDWIRSGAQEAIVGCFVAEKGTNARVGTETARIHYSLFNVPFQLLTTFDPESRRFAASTRAPGSGLFNAAFHVVLSRPKTDAVGEEE